MITEIEIKEQPILMSTPMVQALLNGTKTETRRDKNLKEINENPDDWGLDDPFVDDALLLGNSYFSNYITGEKKIIKKPWRIGNILWVKETWKPAIEGKVTMYNAIRYKADGASIPLPDEDIEWFNNLTKDGKFNYQSSMFMRRKFARIFLNITDIKLERLHDITEEGAIAEGIEPWGSIQGAYFKNYSKNASTDIKHPKHESPVVSNPIKSYRTLWEKINGAESWEKNIYCWVVKF